jgi:hypothetical protein
MREAVEGMKTNIVRTDYFKIFMGLPTTGGAAPPQEAKK